MSVFKTIKHYYDLLKKPIYVGKRLEKHMMISTLIGMIIFFTCALLAIINILQNRGIVICITTIFISVSGLLIAFSSKVLKNIKISIGIAAFVCIFVFTYYTVSGENSGFAILWTLMVPLAFSYFGGVLYGLIISVYYEVLLIVMFYTPMRSFVEGYYSPVFLDRFPILYLCGGLLTAVAMINYHVTVLAQDDYEAKLKNAAKAAITAEKAAISAEKAKSRFLAQMSHEIRTPINAVLGMNEMILHECEDEEILEYAENISTAGKTLLTLINSILDFSKIEDGKMVIIPVKYETVTLITNIVNSVSEHAKRKKLRITADVDPTLPVVLEGDDVRISQIIMNLMTNAVKYTEKGGITLSVKNCGIDGDSINVGVSVKDTGIGIRDEDMGRLFESFERLEEKRNRNIEGTGLGMSIVTGLLEMMGSKLEVASTYGVGSEFSFVLKQKVIIAEPIGDYSEHIAGNKQRKGTEISIYAPDARVLVVDDNEMNLKVAKNLLSLFGIQPELVLSGKEAIEKTREKKYDIILLDHMMPEMDGVETFEKMKEENLLPPGTVVIVLTANAISGAREAYLANGFADYISKPIEMSQLESKLREYLPDEYLRERDTVLKNNNTSVKTVAATQESEPEIIEFSPDGEEAVEFEPAAPDEKSRDYSEVFCKLEKYGLSIETGMKYCAGDESFYAEMLADFSTQSREKTDKLEDFYGKNDMHEYNILVHALKSTSRMIGAISISEKARALEEASGKEDVEYMRQNHGIFISEYRETAGVIGDVLGI